MSDFLDTSKEERDELFQILQIFKNALDKTFKPDKYNYACLGNQTAHCHFHIVPRYKKEIVFDSVTFIDDRWGSNYSPYNKEFKISKDTKQKIIKIIQNEL